MSSVDTGKRIKALRLARGLKQKDLAAAIGIKPPSLSELESGESKAPSGPVLTALCTALGTNAEWLLTGRGDPTPHTAMDGDSSELQAIWQVLPQEGKTALLAAARGLRDAYTSAATAMNPYPKKRVSRSA